MSGQFPKFPGQMETLCTSLKIYVVLRVLLFCVLLELPTLTPSVGYIVLRFPTPTSSKKNHQISIKFHPRCCSSWSFLISSFQWFSSSAAGIPFKKRNTSPLRHWHRCQLLKVWATWASNSLSSCGGVLRSVNAIGICKKTYFTLTYETG